MKKYDVIVAGGGFAGTAAALAAARQGASVLIVDKSNCLGGAAVNCLVNPFMCYWTTASGKKLMLSRGIFEEICNELEKRNAMKSTLFLEEELKLILNRMVQKENISLLFHTYIYDVKTENGSVKSLLAANKSGKTELCADYFIDATGDADIAFLAGCPCRLGRDEDELCQPMTLCFRVANVDVEAFDKTSSLVNELYKKYKAEGKFRNPREDLLIFHTPVKGILHFNTTRIVKKNPVNAEDVTAAEIEAREQIYEVYDFLKNHADGFENSTLIMTAPEIGVRESRMIKGEYILTGKDLVDCKKFDDAIAAGNYDIDIHNPEGSGTSHYYFPQGQYYTIPYRSLLPKNADNLLVAGRCISSDHEAQASYRIMPIVCCIGEAAGTAAGIAKADGALLKQLDIKKLQTTLKNNNAFIG
ncbi:MAG: FAD-dependent oxidoreductase [Clostridia bacterium]|nr:FAD-dependent oxidoreductase [Clostridia bacterium]